MYRIYLSSSMTSSAHGFFFNMFLDLSYQENIFCYKNIFFNKSLSFESFGGGCMDCPSLVHHVIGWWGAFLSLALNLFLSSAPYTFWVRLSMHFWARLSMHFWARLSMHWWARSFSEHGHFLSRASSGIRTVVFINRNVTLKFNVYLTNWSRTVCSPRRLLNMSRM